MEKRVQDRPFSGSWQRGTQGSQAGVWGRGRDGSATGQGGCCDFVNLGLKRLLLPFPHLAVLRYHHDGGPAWTGARPSPQPYSSP